MSLGNCPECKHKVARSAVACPECGNTNFWVAIQKPIYVTCTQCYGKKEVFSNQSQVDEHQRLVEIENEENCGLFCPQSMKYWIAHRITCNQCSGSGAMNNGETRTEWIDCR